MARLVWFVRQQGDQLWICRTVRELFCGTQSFVDNAHLFPVHSLFINIIVSNWIRVSQVEWKFYWATIPWETLLFSRYSSNTIIRDTSAQGKNHKYMNFSQIFIGILLKMVWKYDYVFFGMYIFRVWSTLFSKQFKIISPFFIFLSTLWSDIIFYVILIVETPLKKILKLEKISKPRWKIHHYHPNYQIRSIEQVERVFYQYLQSIIMIKPHLHKIWRNL